jgi:hypothetical protein
LRDGLRGTSAIIAHGSAPDGPRGGGSIVEKDPLLALSTTGGGKRTERASRLLGRFLDSGMNLEWPLGGPIGGGNSSSSGSTPEGPRGGGSSADTLPSAVLSLIELPRDSERELSRVGGPPPSAALIRTELLSKSLSSDRWLSECLSLVGLKSRSVSAAQLRPLLLRDSGCSCSSVGASAPPPTPIAHPFVHDDGMFRHAGGGGKSGGGVIGGGDCGAGGGVGADGGDGGGDASSEGRAAEQQGVTVMVVVVTVMSISVVVVVVVVMLRESGGCACDEAGAGDAAAAGAAPREESRRGARLDGGPSVIAGSGATRTACLDLLLAGPLAGWLGATLGELTHPRL